MRNAFLLGVMVCVLVGMTASCTRIKNKVVGMVQSMDSDLLECNIGTLYPELGNEECIGYADDGLFYNYWFRYRATPTEVEAALLAKECQHLDIEPDTALVPCSREFILSEMKMPPEGAFAEFTEWRTDSTANLLYYKCTRPFIQHLLVFDTSAGLVYHHMGEFR